MVTHSGTLALLPYLALPLYSLSLSLSPCLPGFFALHYCSLAHPSICLPYHFTSLTLTLSPSSYNSTHLEFHDNNTTQHNSTIHIRSFIFSFFSILALFISIFGHRIYVPTTFIYRFHFLLYCKEWLTSVLYVWRISTLSTQTPTGSSQNHNPMTTSQLLTRAMNVKTADSWLQRLKPVDICCTMIVLKNGL